MLGLMKSLTETALNIVVLADKHNFQVFSVLWEHFVIESVVFSLVIFLKLFDQTHILFVGLSLHAISNGVMTLDFDVVVAT